MTTMRGSAAEIWRPSYNPRFLAKVRDRQRRAPVVSQEAPQPGPRAKVVMASAKTLPLLVEKSDGKTIAELRIERIAEMTRNRVGRPNHSRDIISRVVAWHEGVSEDDVYSASRRRPVVAARHEAMCAVYDNCKIRGRQVTLPEMGRLFGGRDHTTVLHAIQKRNQREQGLQHHFQEQGR